MAWVLIHLSASHIHRMYANFGGFELDISTFNMLQVCKLSALAFCYKDGGEKDENLTAEQKRKRVKHLPNPFEMASYTFYVQACALGVFFEYSDYQRFIKRQGEYKQIESPILPSLKTLLFAIFCTGIFIGASPYFNINTCYSGEFAEWTFPYRVVYYMLAMTFKRFFYYGPFLFTTGAIQASGLGYNGEGKWDKIMGVYVWNCETETSVIGMLRWWNHQVHLWLKFYI